MANLDEIERRAHARMIRLGGQGQPPREPDEIEEAIELRERIVAGQVKGRSAEQVLKQMELEDEKTELERRRTKVEAMELDARFDELEQRRRQATQAGEGGGLLQDVLGSILEDSRTSRQQLMALLTAKREEDRARDGVQPSLPTLEQRLAEWETIDNLITSHAQRMLPAKGEGQLVGGDVAGTIRLQEASLKADIERERMRMEARQREEEHELRMQQIRTELDLKREEIGERRARDKRMGDLVEQLGPQAISAFQNSPLMRGPMGAQKDAGIPVRCQNPGCGITFQIRGDEESVLCPHCGQLHVRQGSGPSAPVNAREGRTLDVIEGGRSEPESARGAEPPDQRPLV